jgi:NADPH:quinone reductase-like Zn-dependent oxidoreductase
MKAVRIARFGGPEVVRIEQLTEPKIHSGEALVRVRAAGVNPVDWMIREKIYNPEGADRVPLTLGQDFAGVIERFRDHSGEGTGALREGDEVLGEAWGTFAEAIAVPVKDLVRKPAGIDFVTAAAIPMPGLTAWQMIMDTAHATKGMRFLIHGAGGAVGSFAVQFARLQGAEVIATASASNFKYLKSIGVDRVIDYRKDKFENLVNDVDVVIDPQGGELQQRSWGVLKKGGMLINLVGDIDNDAAEKQGVRGVEFAMRYDVEDLREICALVEKGAVQPHVSRVLDLNDARKAMDLNQQGKSHGKIVLRVA